MKTIAIIIPYFGKFPNYFRLFLDSCSKNESIDWIIFTDDYEDYRFPKNVQVHYTTLPELKMNFQSKFDFKISLERPYKLCDYKVAYGYLFEEYIKEYDFWGYCDVDIIFGDLRSFITNEILDKYVKIFSNGYLSIIKNEENYRKLFMNDSKYFHNYKEIFSSEKSFSFDEYTFNRIIKQMNIPYYYERPFATLIPKHYYFKCLYEENKKISQVFTWENGRLYQYIVKDKKLNKIERAFIHIEKRPMKIKFSKYIKYDEFIICPNCFLLKTKELDVKIVNYLNRRRLFYPYYFKTHTKYLFNRITKEGFSYLVPTMKRKILKKN